MLNLNKHFQMPKIFGTWFFLIQCYIRWCLVSHTFDGRWQRSVWGSEQSTACCSSFLFDVAIGRRGMIEHFKSQAFYSKIKKLWKMLFSLSLIPHYCQILFSFWISLIPVFFFRIQVLSCSLLSVLPLYAYHTRAPQLLSGFLVNNFSILLLIQKRGKRN